MQLNLPIFKQRFKGTRLARLFDTPKVILELHNLGVDVIDHDPELIPGSVLPFNALLIEAKKTLTDEQISQVLDNCAKPMFQWNLLGKLAYKIFHKDFQNFLFGKWTLNPVIANLVVTVGKKVIMKQTNGVSSTAVTYMAIGTGTTAAAAGDTALQTEISTNGGARAVATTSNQTTSTTGDTARWVLTYTFTGSFAVTEEGLLDAASVGNLLAHDVFSAINVISGDTLQITHNIQAT